MTSAKAMFRILGTGWSAQRFARVIESLSECQYEMVPLSRTPALRRQELNRLADEAKRSIFIVATPPFVQASDASVLIAAGHDVVVEKPVGLAPDVTQGLLDVSRSNASVLVPFHLAVNPLIEEISSQMASGSLGGIMHAAFRMNVGRERPSGQWLYDERLSGGIFLETMVHGFHLMAQLLGPIAEVQSAFISRNRVATAVARHVGGVTSTYEVSWYGSDAVRRGHVEVMGDAGAAGFYRTTSGGYELSIEANGHQTRMNLTDEDIGFRRLLAAIATREDPLVFDRLGLRTADAALSAACSARDRAFVN